MSHLVLGSFDKYIRHRTWDIPTSVIFGPVTSEEILQSKLHDPRILRRSDLTKNVAVEIRGWVFHSEAVCDVESLRTEFEFFRFTHAECSGKSRIKLPRSRSQDAA